MADPDPRLVDGMIAHVVNQAWELEEPIEDAIHSVADNLNDAHIEHLMVWQMKLPYTQESVQRLFEALDVAAERLTGENPEFADAWGD